MCGITYLEIKDLCGHGLALHSSSRMWLPPLLLTLSNDLSVHASVFNKFPHFSPIIVSRLLSALHCGAVTPLERARPSERQSETARKEGRKEESGRG